MVRGWKFIILLGGVVGIAAFFFPFLIVSGQGKEVSVSAFEAVTGLEAIEESAESAEVKAANAQLVEIVDRVQGFLYAVYAPAVLIALFGLIGVARMRFGRILAFFTLLVGAATGAIWYLLSQAAAEAGAQVQGIQSSLGLGVHLLLFTGAAAALGGLVNLVKPDRGYPTL